MPLTFVRLCRAAGLLAVASFAFAFPVAAHAATASAPNPAMPTGCQLKIGLVGDALISGGYETTQTVWQNGVSSIVKTQHPLITSPMFEGIPADTNLVVYTSASTQQQNPALTEHDVAMANRFKNGGTFVLGVGVGPYADMARVQAVSGRSWGREYRRVDSIDGLRAVINTVASEACQAPAPRPPAPAEGPRLAPFTLNIETLNAEAQSRAWTITNTAVKSTVEAPTSGPATAAFKATVKPSTSKQSTVTASILVSNQGAEPFDATITPSVDIAGMTCKAAETTANVNAYNTHLFEATCTGTPAVTAGVFTATVQAGENSSYVSGDVSFVAAQGSVGAAAPSQKVTVELAGATPRTLGEAVWSADGKATDFSYEVTASDLSATSVSALVRIVETKQEATAKAEIVKASATPTPSAAEPPAAQPPAQSSSTTPQPTSSVGGAGPFTSVTAIILLVILVAATAYLWLLENHPKAAKAVRDRFDYDLRKDNLLFWWEGMPFAGWAASTSAWWAKYPGAWATKVARWRNNFSFADVFSRKRMPSRSNARPRRGI